MNGAWVESSPFAVLERSFGLLASGPAPPVLATTGITGVSAAKLSAEALTPLLRSGPVEVADELWRRVIGRVRAGESVWSVVACGVMLPRLVATCARFGRVPSDHIADMEAEMLTALLGALRSLDLKVEDVGGQLWYAAFNAATRYRHRVERDATRLALSDRLEVCSRPSLWRVRGPVSVLAQALTSGVLTEVEAELVARTRLESQTLGQAAAELGLAYITARRHRRRGEERLASWLGAKKSSPEVSANAA